MNVQFIAEVASNHNRDFERCCKFIEAARDLGCDGVKFQLFKIERLFAPEILAVSELHRRRKTWELPPEYIPELVKLAHQLDLRFACSPFDVEAVAELQPHVDFYKISSYELPWHDLLAACAATEKPVALSTGMATLEEVRSGVKVLVANGCGDITLLHCVSAYPASPESCNLSAIEAMRNKLTDFNKACRLHFGWSDHSGSAAVIARAVHRWGAEMIEFHLDLDGQGAESGLGHCWRPEQIRAVIKDIRMALESDGDGNKRPDEKELAERVWRADPEDGLRPIKRLRRECTQ